MKRLTNYQQNILNNLKSGMYLQSTEGKNYKTYLIEYKNGKQINKISIRRDSAEKICDEFSDKLVFGDFKGIYWRK
jgi:hypothetical protein